MRIAKHHPKRAIRLPTVCNLSAMSPATVWRKAKNDPSFPKPFRLSAGITAWDEGEVLAWISKKMTERGAA